MTTPSPRAAEPDAGTPTPAPTVDGLSVSWVWTAAEPTRFDQAGGAPATSRWAGFAGAIAGTSTVFQLPWSADRTYSHYWERQLGAGYRTPDPDGTRAQRAWKRQLPLRDGSPPAVAVAAVGCTASVERLLYPTGSAVILTVRVAGHYAPAELSALVAGLATQPLFSVAGSGAAVPVRAVLDTLLDGIEVAVLGASDPARARTQLRPTLATVTAATGWPQTPIGQGDDVHRLLDGLCRMIVVPAGTPQGALADQLVAVANSRQDTTRMAVADGAAVWSPRQAADPDSGARLACYHHNLTLLIAQTGVLLDTAQWIADAPRTWLNKAGTADVLDLVLNLIGLINGKTDVYTSALARRLIARSGLVPTVNELRAQRSIGRPLDVTA